MICAINGRHLSFTFILSSSPLGVGRLLKTKDSLNLPNGILSAPSRMKDMLKWLGKGWDHSWSSGAANPWEIRNSTFFFTFFSPLRILHLTLLRLERLAYNGLEFWKQQKQQNNRTKNKNNENVENFLFEQRVCSKLLPFNLMYNTVSCNAHKESMFSKSKIIITWIPTTVFSFPIKNIIICMSLKSMCYETKFLI